MESLILWVARLPCGCVVDVCTSFDDTRLWLYSVQGNGWIVEAYSAQEAECPACRAAQSLTQARLF